MSWKAMFEVRADDKVLKVNAGEAFLEPIDGPMTGRGHRGLEGRSAALFRFKATNFPAQCGPFSGAIATANARSGRIGLDIPAE
jgi:hypothetical protein